MSDINLTPEERIEALLKGAQEDISAALVLLKLQSLNSEKALVHSLQDVVKGRVKEGEEG